MTLGMVLVWYLELLQNLIWLALSVMWHACPPLLAPLAPMTVALVVVWYLELLRALIWLAMFLVWQTFPNYWLHWPQ